MDKTPVDCAVRTLIAAGHEVTTISAWGDPRPLYRVDGVELTAVQLVQVAGWVRAQGQGAGDAEGLTDDA